jgi:hypothetical protein
VTVKFDLSFAPHQTPASAAPVASIGKPRKSDRPTMKSTFARELDQLIKKHLGQPQYGEDFRLVIDGLLNAADKLAEQADTYSWRADERERRARRASVNG